jgi:uncharacterized membrane protein YdjX (TVP38/TMEM64 family)
MSPASTSPRSSNPKRRPLRWWPIVLTLAVLILIWVLSDVRQLLEQTLHFIGGLGAWGPVLFILVYAIGTVLFIPGSILTLGAGALFGVLWGSIYVSLGSTLGATCAFLVGRYFARDWVESRIEGQPKFEAVDRAVAAEGWKIVFLARLSPVFPFALLNYAFGLTRVSLLGYVAASWVGMMPATVMYVFVGSLAREGALGHPRPPGEWILYAVGLVATIIVTVWITRMARRALTQRADLDASS